MPFDVLGYAFWLCELRGPVNCRQHVFSWFEL